MHPCNSQSWSGDQETAAPVFSWLLAGNLSRFLLNLALLKLTMCDLQPSYLQIVAGH